MPSSRSCVAYRDDHRSGTCAPPPGEAKQQDTMKLTARKQFLAAIRAEAEAGLARLDLVDRDSLPEALRSVYDESRRGWEQLRRMTDDEVVPLLEAACAHAGRPLTEEELRGLFDRQ